MFSQSALDWNWISLRNRSPCMTLELTMSHVSRFEGGYTARPCALVSGPEAECIPAGRHSHKTSEPSAREQSVFAVIPHQRSSLQTQNNLLFSPLGALVQRSKEPTLAGGISPVCQVKALGWQVFTTSDLQLPMNT